MTSSIKNPVDKHLSTGSPSWPQRLIRHLSVRDTYLTLQQRLFLSYVVLALLLSLSWVNPWAVSVVGGALSAIAANAYRRGQELRHWGRRKWLLSLAAFLVWIVVYLQYRTVIGQNAGIAAISMLVALKLFELDKRRDGLILLFLAQILVMGLFFVSQEIYAALCAIFMEIMLFAGQRALFQNPHERFFSAWSGLRTSARLVLISLLLGAVLFVVFPRPNEPLWSVGVQDTAGTSGLSESMKAGGVDQHNLSSEIAFTVQMESPSPPPEKRYWRGPSFANYRYGQWSPKPELTSDDAASTIVNNSALQSAKTVWRYEITVEPQARTWLYGLEQIVSVDGLKAQRQSDGLWVSFALPNQRKSARLISVDEPLSANLEGLAGSDIAAYLRFNNEPNSPEPRLRALAGQWREAALAETGESPITPEPALARYPAPLPSRTAQAVVDRALKFFREEDFTYALNDVRLPEQNPMDTFLFEKKRGFCESYASAFALLMRSAGIPTRVVTGYQGGEINPIGDTWTIRQSDAHAWNEVLIGGRWLRIDPTAAVSPLRIEQSLSASLGNAQGLGLLSQNNNYSWARRAMLAWEGTQNTWNRWVVQFDDARQFDFFSRFLGAGFNKTYLSAFSALIVLAFLGFAYWRNRPRPLQTALENVWWNEVINRLGERAHRVHPAMTANEVYEQVAQDVAHSAKKQSSSNAPKHPSKKPLTQEARSRLQALKEFIRVLQQLKYAPQPQRQEFLAQLKAAKRRI